MFFPQSLKPDNLGVAALWTFEFRISKPFINEPWKNKAQEEEYFKKLGATSDLPQYAQSLIPAIGAANIMFPHILPLLFLVFCMFPGDQISALIKMRESGEE